MNAVTPDQEDPEKREVQPGLVRTPEEAAQEVLQQEALQREAVRLALQQEALRREAVRAAEEPVPQAAAREEPDWRQVHPAEAAGHPEVHPAEDAAVPEAIISTKADGDLEEEVPDAAAAVADSSSWLWAVCC